MKSLVQGSLSQFFNFNQHKESLFDVIWSISSELTANQV